MKIHQEVILSDFILQYGLKRIAEIGVWKGHTVRKIMRRSNVYDFIDEYWAIDQWRVLSREHGRKLAARTQEHWDSMYKYCCGLMVFYPKLRTMKLTSLEASTLFPDEYFCLVFIDASHLYEDVKRDINIWWNKIKFGGFLFGHDYGVRGGVEDAVNEEFDNVLLEPSADLWYKRRIQ